MNSFAPLVAPIIFALVLFSIAAIGIYFFAKRILHWSNKISYVAISLLVISAMLFILIVILSYYKVEAVTSSILFFGTILVYSTLIVSYVVITKKR